MLYVIAALFYCFLYWKVSCWQKQIDKVLERMEANEAERIEDNKKFWDLLHKMREERKNQG